MSDTPEPHAVVEDPEEHHLAGRHHVALQALRPYFATRKLDPADAPAFVRHSLNVSRVLREMGLAQTAANVLSAILPGLAGGKSKGSAQLWEALQNLRTARNKFAHKARQQSAGKVVDHNGAAQLVTPGPCNSHFALA